MPAVQLEDLAQQVRLLRRDVATPPPFQREDDVGFWSAAGPLQVTTGHVRAPIVNDCTITRIIVTLDTAPAFGAEVNVNVNGTSLITAGNIPIGAGENLVEIQPDTTSLVEGDYLTADVITADGSDITIVVYATS